MRTTANLSFIAGKSQRRLHLIEFVLCFVAGCLLAIGWGSLSQAIPVQQGGVGVPSTPSPLLLSAPPLSYAKQSTGSENRPLSCRVGCRYGSLNVRGSRNRFNKHHGWKEVKSEHVWKSLVCSHNQSDYLSLDGLKIKKNK